MGQRVRNQIVLAEIWWEGSWRETAAEVFHWIGAGFAQMLPYNSGTFCGYQLHSVVINYPVQSFQTKASHAFNFSKLFLSLFFFFLALEKFPGSR